jgi:hypothetical protein
MNDRPGGNMVGLFQHKKAREARGDAAPLYHYGGQKSAFSLPRVRDADF